MKQRIKVIGITGGIASGKSTVAEMLRSLGAVVIDADKICHQLIDTEEIKEKTIKRWGNHIQNKKGKIDRDILGKIVFSDKRELLALNKIIHPKTLKQIRSQISKLKHQATTKAIVLDAALLVESKLTDICDTTLFVDTKKYICNKRVQKRPRWSLREITKREKFQSSLREKRKIAGIVINNNLSKTKTFNQVKGFWNQFVINN